LCLSKEGFDRVLTPATTPLRPGGPETLKAKRQYLKTVYKTKDVQMNPGSAGYLSTSNTIPKVAPRKNLIGVGIL